MVSHILYAETLKFSPTKEKNGWLQVVSLTKLAKHHDQSSWPPVSSGLLIGVGCVKIVIGPSVGEDGHQRKTSRDSHGSSSKDDTSGHG